MAKYECLEWRVCDDDEDQCGKYNRAADCSHHESSPGEVKLEKMLMGLVIRDHKAQPAVSLVFILFAHKCFFLNFAAVWTES